MKVGYFDTKEFESKDGAKSPFESHPRKVG